MFTKKGFEVGSATLSPPGVQGTEVLQLLGEKLATKALVYATIADLKICSHLEGHAFKDTTNQFFRVGERLAQELLPALNDSVMHQQSINLEVRPRSVLSSPIGGQYPSWRPDEIGTSIDPPRNVIK
jgi:hypothetical protein